MVRKLGCAHMIKSEAVIAGVAVGATGLAILSWNNERLLRIANERLKDSVFLWRTLCLTTWAVGGGILIL